MHFSQAVAIIQSQVGVIKGVQVLYSETVSTRDYCLSACFTLFYQMILNVFCNKIVLSPKKKSSIESIGRGYCDKFAAGWHPIDF